MEQAEIDSLLHFLRKFQGGRGNEQLQNGDKVCAVRI